MASKDIRPKGLNKVENYGAIIVLCLLGFRFLFGVGLDFFLLTAITILAVFYLWFGFFLFNKAVPFDLLDRRKRAGFTPLRTVSSILMGMVYSVCLIAVLYAVFFYTRMQFMLGFSVFLLGVSTTLILVYHWFNRTDSAFLGQFYRRTAIMGAFIIGLTFTPVDTRLKLLYADFPGFIEAYREYRENPESEQALEQLRSERSKFR
jgi:hypothetical protein